MNKQETDLVEEAIRLLEEGPEWTTLAIDDLRAALKVRTALPVCEICNRVGGCDHHDYMKK